MRLRERAKRLGRGGRRAVAVGAALSALAIVGAPLAGGAGPGAAPDLLRGRRVLLCFWATW